MFKATDRDKKLAQDASNVVLVTTSQYLANCAKQCTSLKQSRSFNFKKTGNSNCEILDIDKTNGSSRLENAPGWIHFEPISQVNTP